MELTSEKGPEAALTQHNQDIQGRHGKGAERRQQEKPYCGEGKPRKEQGKEQVKGKDSEGTEAIASSANPEDTFRTK